MDKRYFSKKIAEWYEQNKRSLPWRETKDPYCIWLSEVILQQTRVNQGLPYYLKFIETFPTVEALANAPLEKVLRLWQGLGYYTRARNLHKCAKVVVREHNGLFPTTYEELKKLPGIGDYTAAAIASICFEEPVAVVDGNVFRVLSRTFGIDTAINSSQGKGVFTALANLLVSSHAGVHNQAVMEFGALQCTPKNPQCETCVFKPSCAAYKSNLQEKLPVKLRKVKVRRRYFYYLVLQKGNSLALNPRTEKDIWHSLYDFPLVESAKPVKPLLLLSKEKRWSRLISKKANLAESKVYKHVLSHQVIYAQFIHVKMGASRGALDGLKFFSFKKIAALPKPILITRFLADQQLL